MNVHDNCTTPVRLGLGGCRSAADRCLLVLDRGTVRYRRENEALTSIRLTPATAAQARQLGRSAGLWETQETYQRRH